MGMQLSFSPPTVVAGVSATFSITSSGGGDLPASDYTLVANGPNTSTSCDSCSFSSKDSVVSCTCTLTTAESYYAILSSDEADVVGFGAFTVFEAPTPLYVRPVTFALVGGDFFTVKLDVGALPVQDSPVVRFLSGGVTVADVTPEVFLQGGYVFLSGRSAELDLDSGSALIISYSLNGQQFIEVPGEGGASIVATDQPAFKVGFLMHQSIALDNGYTYSQNLARLNLAMTFGDRVDVSNYLDALDNYGDDICGDTCMGPSGWCTLSADCPYSGLTHASYVEGKKMFEEQGVDMLVGITYEYWQDLEQLAKEYPNKKILQTSPGAGTLTSNFARFMTRQDEGFYMMGYAVGKHPYMQKHPRAGYVAATKDAATDLIGFAKGFRDAIGPDSRVYVVWTQDWGSSRREKVAAERLFKTYNVSVFATICNTLEGNQMAEDLGRYSTGLNLDVMSVIGPSTLVSFLQVYDNGVNEFVSAAMAGIPWGEDGLTDAGASSPPLYMEHGYMDGGWKFSSYSTEMPSEARKLADARLAELQAGEDDIWCNVLRDPTTGAKMNTTLFGGSPGECPGTIDYDAAFDALGVVYTCTEAELHNGFCYVGTMDVTDDVPDLCEVGYTITADGCSPCAPGYESNVDGTDDSECVACSLGSYTPGNAVLCQHCPTGSYADSDGMSECKQASVGNFVLDSGAHTQLECPAGSFVSEVGQSECVSCPRGSYQDERGQSVCKTCNTGLTTEEIAATSVSSCVRVPCDEGYFLSSNESRGCLPCPSSCDGTACDCPGGVLPPRQLAGFRVGAPSSEDADVTFSVRCKDSLACPEGLALGACPEHRDETSIACDVCEIGFYEDGDLNCVSCTENFSGLPLVLTIVVGILACICLFYFVTRNITVQSSNIMTVALSFTIMMNTLQVLGAFREIVVDWPEPLKGLYTVLKVFTLGFDLLKPGCIFNTNNSVISYAGTLCTYPIFACFVMVVFIAARFLPEKCSRPASMTQFANSQGLILLMFYISLSVIALQSLHCESNPDGSSSVVAYRSVLCWETSKHSAMLVFSILGILFYAVTFLGIVAWASLRYPREVVRPGGINFVRRYQFLFQRFRNECYYYGFIYCFRNLLVAILPVIFVNVVVAQFCLLVLLIAIGLAVQSWLQPWRTMLANFLDCCCSLALIIVLTGGAMLVDIQEGESHDVVQIFFIAFLTALVTLIVIVFLLSIYRIFVPQKAFGAFLCHHKEGGSVLARWIKLELADKVFDKIFLDSDMLDRLDQIFELTAHQTKNLIIILTKETMRRIWCAGEITAAIQQKVPTIQLECTGFDRMTEKEIAELGSVWTESQKTDVENLGVAVHQIQAAYRILNTMKAFKLDRTDQHEAQVEVLTSVINNCKGYVWKPSHLASGGSRSSQTSTQGGIVLLTDQTNMEGTTLSFVLQRMLQKTLRLGVSIAGSFNAQDEADKEKFYNSDYLLVLLVRGVLENTAFAQKLAIARKFTHLDLVSVVADEGFVFPDPIFWHELPRGKVVGGSLPAHELEAIVLAYQGLFNILALRFSPRGSESIQQTEISEMVPRFRAGIDRDGTGSTSASRRRSRPSEAETACHSLPVVVDQPMGEDQEPVKGMNMSSIAMDSLIAEEVPAVDVVLDSFVITDKCEL